MKLFTFEWLAGSASDHFVRYCKENGIAFHYDHFGNLYADLYGVGIMFRFGYQHISGNTFQAIATQA